MSAAEQLDASHRVYANRRSVRFTEMEYAIPREHVARGARARARAWSSGAGCRSASRSRCASAAPDDGLLSTAHGRATGYIAVHQYRGMEFESYFRAVEAIMDEYGGRPHWGKRHYQSRRRCVRAIRAGTASQRSATGSTRERKFENDYLRRVLG